MQILAFCEITQALWAQLIKLLQEHFHHQDQPLPATTSHFNAVLEMALDDLNNLKGS